MRHRNTVTKLGRKAEHRDAMLANQVCSLIKHERIKTTLAKAKATRILAEKMVTLGKDGSLHSRRLAVAALKQQDAVRKLFEDIAPRSATRKGGYTRIIKLGPRLSDAAPMAFLEWVDQSEADVEVAAPETKKPAKKKAESKAPAAKKEKKAEPEEAAAPSEEPKAEEPAEVEATEPAADASEAAATETEEKPKVRRTPAKKKDTE